MTRPPTTEHIPTSTAAIHTTRLRPLRLHAHAGRRAMSSSAHTDMAKGMLAIATTITSRASRPTSSTASR